MFLRDSIHKRLSSPKTKIYSKTGKRVPVDVLQLEYQKIKSFVADQCLNDSAVAIKLEKDYRYLLSMLACMEVGVPYIPMKVDFPMDRVEQIRKDAKFKVIFDDALVAKIISEEYKECSEVNDVSEKKPLYIMFTSGSTGRPKGVVISRSAASNFYQWLNDYFGDVNEEDHLLQVTQFTFDISLVDVFLFLEKNVSLYFSEFEQDIFKLAYEIEQFKISTLSTVPNNLNMLLDDFLIGRVDYSSLKTLLIAGARFSYGLYEKCKAHIAEKKIYNCYGPTECTVYSHAKFIEFKESDMRDHNVSIGVPLYNIEAKIVSDELLLSGVQVMNEYINNPERTAEALEDIDGKIYYHTGDVVFKDEDGQYYVTGRKDDTIKYRGYRINLLDIDSYICRLPYVQDSTTIAVADELKENLTIGFVILKEEKTVAQVKEDLAELLLSYQIPEKIIFIDKYPVNTSGKIDKKLLKEQYEQDNLS